MFTRREEQPRAGDPARARHRRARGRCQQDKNSRVRKRGTHGTGTRHTQAQGAHETWKGPMQAEGDPTRHTTHTQWRKTRTRTHSRTSFLQFKRPVQVEQSGRAHRFETKQPFHSSPCHPPLQPAQRREKVIAPLNVSGPCLSPLQPASTDRF